jgi:hypothetical protein
MLLNNIAMENILTECEIIIFFLKPELFFRHENTKFLIHEGCTTYQKTKYQKVIHKLIRLHSKKLRGT